MHSTIDDDETRDDILNGILHRDECNYYGAHQFLFLLKSLNGLEPDNKEKV